MEKLEIKVKESCYEIWTERTLESTIEVNGKNICFRIHETPKWSDTYILVNDNFVRINECENQEIKELIEIILDNYQIFDFDTVGQTVTIKF